MKRKKLLRKLKTLLSADKRAQIAKYDSLAKVLNNLEAREAKLREKLDSAEDDRKRREICRKLEVLEAQRKKGIKLKHELEALRDAE